MSKEFNPNNMGDIFKNAQNELPKVIEKTLNIQAEDLLGDAVDLAPLDEGGLRESGSVDPAKQNGYEIVSRAGFSKEYALRMHEDLYTPSTPGTGRKYLEKPTTQNREKYHQHMADSIKDAFK